MDIKNLVKEYFDYGVEMRRYFHQYPELSWQEFNTSKKIKEELDKMEIPHKTVKETGVLGFIKGKNPGKKLGIRADIDALPVTEETGLDFASENEGVMHACGHDMHTATLLATAKVLNELKDEFNGEIVLIFQPAEEFIEDSGAEYLAELKEIQSLDRIIGLHVWANMPVGTASIKVGPIMASSDTFDIYIKGLSGHGATPNLSIDPIIAGGMVVEGLQTIVSRENDPLQPQVISVTAFNSGNSKNVIPEMAHLMGTTRAFDNDIRLNYEKQIRRILDGVETLTRSEIELDYQYGCPPTINNEEAAMLGMKIAKGVLPDGLDEDFPILMGGEDFSKYLAHIPGCFMLLGGGIEGGLIAQHNEKFDIDEKSIEYGMEYFVRYAIEYLD